MLNQTVYINESRARYSSQNSSIVQELIDCEKFNE
jgi:hypothetical protein